MSYAHEFAEALDGLTQLVDAGILKPMHIRGWLSVIDTKGVLRQTLEGVDPSDMEELDRLSEQANEGMLALLCEILRRGVGSGPDELTEQELHSFGELSRGVRCFVDATAARNNRGETGWIHAIVALLEGAGEGLVTPQSMNILRQALVPPSSPHTPSFDA